MKFPKHLMSYWVTKFLSFSFFIGLIIGITTIFNMFSENGMSFLSANSLNYDFSKNIFTSSFAQDIKDVSSLNLDEYRADSGIQKLKVEKKNYDIKSNVKIASANSTVDFSSGLSYPYTKTFLISAYYSPLPCQNRYATGSYEADIRLNGHGIRGADGTGVYPGMIAAPKSMPFGTKLNVEGLGIGTVHDRGGAIVVNGSGGYDRLDIWMGYGDPGLIRALNYGKRLATVTVYGPSSGIADNLYIAGFSKEESIPKQCTVSEKIPEVKESIQNPVVPNNESLTKVTNESLKIVKSDNKVFFQELYLGSSGSQVKKLQEELITMNLLKKSPNGVYDDVTQHAVFKFQQAHGIVASYDELGAGRVGPKTRETLNSLVAFKSHRLSDVQKVQGSLSSGDAKKTIASTTVKPEEIETKIDSTENPSSYATIIKTYGKESVPNEIEDSVNKVVVAPVSEKNVSVAVVAKQNSFSKELDPGMTDFDVYLLQKYLKEKGYFNHPNFSYFYGPATKEAVIKFQLDNKIISSVSASGAGRVGQGTLKILNT